MANKRQTCQLIQPNESYAGKQALTYFAGVSVENTGAEAIWAIPPNGRAKAHLHESHETVIYVLSGQAGMWFGDSLEEHMSCKAGDFVHIPAGVPHLPYNASDSEPCTAVVARTDPNEQESVVLRPDLDASH